MPTRPEKPFGDKFIADNDAQKGLLSVFTEILNFDRSPGADEVLEFIQESMSAVQFVHPDIVIKLPIYTKIKTFLSKYSIDCPTTKESGSLLAKRLICRIWRNPEFQEERYRALELFDYIRSGGSALAAVNIPSARSLPSTRSNSNSSSSRTISNDIAKRFSNSISKFGGETDECMSKFIDSYSRACTELEVGIELKVKLFHHILRDHALDFYRDNIEGKINNWGELLRKMSDEFNSDVKMETIAAKLKTLHISQFEVDENKEDEALGNLAKTIQKLVPQAPPECRSDRFRKSVLQDATKGKDWALSVTSSTYFRKLTYQQLLHELQNSQQQYKLHKNYNNVASEVILRKDKVSSINYAGQGKYVRSNQLSAGSSRKYNTKDFKCWNCDRTNCSVNQCPYPKDPAKIRSNRIKFFERKKGVKLDNKIRDTLFDFCTTMEEEYPPSENSESDNSNTENCSMVEIQNTLAKNISNQTFAGEDYDLGF